MIMRFLRTTLACVLCTTLLAPVAHSQERPSVQACTEQMHTEVSRLHRVFRAVIFGHRDAKSAPIGYITHAVDGSSWYKVSESAWRSLNEGYTSTTQFNDTIDKQSEITATFGVPNRRGIFETRNVMTSELIPHIGVSLRAFQCQLLQFCNAVNTSKTFNNADPQPIVAEYPGCIPVQRTSIQACHTNDQSSNADSVALYHNCEEVVRSLLDHEANVLNIAVQYDAAYRSILQIAGSLDLFLEELHWPMTHTLREATDLISILGRIPCFVASCEAYPPENNK